MLPCSRPEGPGAQPQRGKGEATIADNASPPCSRAGGRRDAVLVAVPCLRLSMFTVSSLFDPFGSGKRAAPLGPRSLAGAPPRAAAKRAARRAARVVCRRPRPRSTKALRLHAIDTRQTTESEKGVLDAPRPPSSTRPQTLSTRTPTPPQYGERESLCAREQL